MRGGRGGVEEGDGSRVVEKRDANNTIRIDRREFMVGTKRSGILSRRRRVKRGGDIAVLGSMTWR